MDAEHPFPRHAEVLCGQDLENSVVFDPCAPRRPSETPWDAGGFPSLIRKETDPQGGVIGTDSAAALI